MRRRVSVAFACTIVAVVAMSSSSASAATEVGNRCVGNLTVPGKLAVGLANAPGDPLPATVPSAGVITRWSQSVIPLDAEEEEELDLVQTLRILRPAGIAKQFQVVGESAPVQVVGNLTTHATRIPVQAGDHLASAVASPEGTGSLICQPKTASGVVGVISGNPVAGTTGTVETEVPDAQVPIVAFVEPDADNDGHGDETQDQCPQNAATQGPCPPPPAPLKPVALSGSSVVTGNLIKVLISSTSDATVTVAGSVKLGKRKSAKLNGGAQALAAGVLAQFVVPLPKAVTNKLKTLNRKRTLAVNLTATGTNQSGPPTVTTLKAKLRGQAKPKPKRPKGQRG